MNCRAAVTPTKRTNLCITCVSPERRTTFSSVQWAMATTSSWASSSAIKTTSWWRLTIIRLSKLFPWACDRTFEISILLHGALTEMSMSGPRWSTLIEFLDFQMLIKKSRAMFKTLIATRSRKKNCHLQRKMMKRKVNRMEKMMKKSKLIVMEILSQKRSQTHHLSSRKIRATVFLPIKIKCWKLNGIRLWSKSHRQSFVLLTTVRHLCISLSLI